MDEPADLGNLSGITMKTCLSLCAIALCFLAAAPHLHGAEIPASDEERTILGSRWDVTTEVGQRAWGDIRFREGNEFSTMNGPQGAWKMTGRQTVDLGGRYVIRFSPGLDSFVVTGLDGAKVATGVRKAEVIPVARILDTPPPTMRTVPDPPLYIPPLPGDPAPTANPTPAAPPVPAPVAAMPPKKKVPVGVPADAKFFNGKWYRVYLEALPWRNARDRCKVLGGMLACVHDQPTGDLVTQLADGSSLWLGATDEDSEEAWRWVDGKAMTYKPEGRFQPVFDRKVNWLAIDNGRWAAFPIKTPSVTGFICEWKDW